MKELKASTKAGERVIAMGDFLNGYYLSDIYNSYSKAKENAWKWCYNEFCKTENATGFSIGNANTFGFTASWLGTEDGENIMRVETKDNSYKVWLDR